MRKKCNVPLLMTAGYGMIGFMATIGLVISGIYGHKTTSDFKKEPGLTALKMNNQREVTFDNNADGRADYIAKVKKDINFVEVGMTKPGLDWMPVVDRSSLYRNNR